MNGVMTTDNEKESPAFNPFKHRLREWEVTDANGTSHKVLMTDNWTVIHPSWVATWILKVWEAEREVGHAICGWATVDGTPCKNYPIADENILNESMVGKCGLHSNPPPPKEEPLELQVREITDIVPTTKAGLPDTPSFKMFTDIAIGIFTRCTNCSYKFKCDRKGENDGVCIKEYDLFTTLMTDIVKQYSLIDAVDHMVAFTLVTAFVDYIKTHIYEVEHGAESAMKDGMLALRLQLNRLIQQNMRTLGIDRKFRIVLRSGDERKIAERSLAELMADKTFGEVETTAQQTTVVTSFKRVPAPPKERAFIGLGGNTIIDTEYEVSDDS